MEETKQNRTWVGGAIKILDRIAHAEQVEGEGS